MPNNPTPTSLESLFAPKKEVKSGILESLFNKPLSQGSDISNIYNPTSKNYEEFGNYDQFMTPEADQESIRSINQGTGRELANGLGRAALKVLPSIIGNVASIADLEDYLNQDKEVGNAVTRYMEELKGGIDKTMPIYGEHDLDALDMGKSEWWTSNFSGLAESAASFALTGAGLGAGVKGLGFLSKIAGASSTVQKAIQAGGGVATAVALNQAEAITSAMSVYDNAFKYQTETLGKSEEEAKQIAADAAAYTVNINRLNLPLNITSTLAFLRTSPMTRQAIQQAGLKSAGMKIMEEGAQEFGEEIINKVAEDEGNRYGKIGKEYNYNLNNTISDVFSAEGLEAGILGALGGIAQTGLSEGLDIATGKSEEQNKLYEKQQASLKQLDLMVGGPSLKSVVKNITAQASLINDINDAQASGDELKVESLKNSLLINQAVNSFDAGTTDKLEELYTTISKTPEQEGEAKYGKGFRENATKAISQIKEWEHAWNKSMQTTPDDVNKKELFINKLQQQSLNDRINDLKQTGLKLNTEILSIKENSPEATELPQELELKNVNNSIGSLQKQLAFVQEQSKSILYPEVKPKQKFTVPKETVDAVNQESAQVKTTSTPKSEFDTIADKIKKGETLSKEELAYHAAKTQEVEDILKNDLQLTEEERAQIQNQAYQDAMDEAYSEEDSKDTSVDMGDLVGISTSKNLKKIGNFSAKNTDVKVGDYLGEDKIIELRYIGTGNRDGQIGVITLLSDNGKKTSYDARKIGGELYREETVPTPQATPENTSQKPIKTENIADKKADIERLEKEKQKTLKPLIEEKEQIEKEIEEIEKAADSREEKGKRNNIVPISTKEAERLLKHLSKKYGILGVLTDLLPEFTYGKFTTEKILINKNTYYDEKGDITFESKGFVNKTTIYHEYLHPFVQILERVNPELYEKIYQDSLSSDIDISHYIKDVRKEERVVRYLDKLSAQEKTPSLLQQFFDFLSDLFFKNKKSDYRTLQKLNINTTVEELYNIFKNYGNLREGSEKVKEERFLKLEATQLENLINLNAGDVESHKTELEIIKQKLDLLNRYDVDKLQQLKQKLAEVNKKIDEVTKRFDAQIAQKQAELKAETTSNQSEIEVKKADIERRRQEELDSVDRSNYEKLLKQQIEDVEKYGQSQDDRALNAVRGMLYKKYEDINNKYDEEYKKLGNDEYKKLIEKRKRDKKIKDINGYRDTAIKTMIDNFNEFHELSNKTDLTEREKLLLNSYNNILFNYDIKTKSFIKKDLQKELDRINAEYDAELNKLESEKSTQKPTGPELVAKRSIRRAELKKEGKTVQEVNAILDEEFPLDSFESLLDSFEPGNTIGNLERLQSQIDKINSQSDKALNQEVKLVLNTVSAIAKEKTAQKDMSPLTREDVINVFTSIAENQPHLIDRIVAGVNGSLGLVTVPSIATVANTQTIEPVVSTKEIEEEAKEKLLDNSGFKITTGFTAATKIVATDSRDNPLFENGKIKFENNEYTKDYIKMHTNAVQIGDVWTIELKNDIDEDTPLDDLELELVYTNPETNETESRGFVHKEAYITEDNTTLTGEELQKEKERIRAIRQFYKDGGSGKQVKVIETTLAKPEFNQRTEIANLDGISVEMMQNVVVYSNGKFITKDGAEFKKSIPDVEDLKSGMVYFMAPQATHVGNEMTHLPILLIKKTFRSYGKINQTLSEIREAIKKELTGVLEGKKLPKGNTTEKFLFIDSSNKDSDAYRIKIKGNTIEYAGGFIAKTKDDLDKVLDDTIFNFNAKGDKAYRDQVQKAGLLVSNLATLESEGTTLYAFQPTYIFQEISPENPATITSETKIEETTPIVETQESNLAEVQEELKKKGVVLDWEVNEGLDSLEVIPEKQGSEIISLVDDENIVNSLAFQVIQDTRLDPGAKTTIDSLKPKFEEIVELLKSVKGSDKIIQRAQEHIEKYQDVLDRFDEFKIKAEEKLKSMNFTKNKQGFYEDIVDQEDSPSQYQDESSYLENRLDSMPAMVRKLMSYLSDYDSNGKIKRNILGLPTYVPVDIISNNVFEILTPHVYVNSKASLDKMIDLLGQSQNPTVKELHQILSTTKNNQLKQQFYKVFSIERDKPESFVFTDKDGKVKLRKNASDNSSGEAIIREEWVKAMESNTSMSSLDKEFITKTVSNFSEFLERPGNFFKQKEGKDKGTMKATSQGVEELVGILNSLELAVDKPAIYSWLIGDKNVSGKRNDKEHIKTQIGTYIIRELESAKTLEDFITSTSGKLSSLSHHTAITSNRMIGGTYRVDGNTYNVHANSKPMTEKLHWINSIWDDLQEHPVYKYLYSRLNEMKVITDRGFRENKKGTRPKMMKDSNEGEFELMRILQFQEFGQLKTETHSDKATNFTVTGSTANNIKILDQKEDGKYEVSSEIVNALYNYFDMEVAKIQTYKARMANSALLKLKGVDSTPDVKGAGEYFMYNDSLNAEILAESNNPLDKKILNELYDKNKEGVYRLKDNINLSPEVVSAIRSKLKERFRSIVGETMTSWKKFGVFESEGSDVTKINFMDEKYKDKLTKDYSHLKDKAQLTTVMQHAYTDYSLNYVQSLLETNFIFGDPAQQSKIKVSENSLTAAQVLKGIKETFVNVSKRNARLLAQGGRAAWRKTSYKTQLFNDLDTDSQNVTQYLEEVQKAYKNDKNNELMTDAQEFTTVLEHLEDRLENGEINFTEFEGGMLMFDPEHYKEMLKNPEFMSHYPQASFRPIEINERMTLNSMGLLQPRKPVQVYSKMEGGIIQEYYIKTSSVPIIPALVKDKPFEKVLELMKKNDVQRMTFNSAVKIGQSGVQNLFNEDGSVNEEGFSTPMTLDRSGYHIQLNVPYDEDKHAIRQGSQVLKLLFVDLPEFVVVNGKKVANELRPGVTVQSLKKKYVELQKKMVKEGQAALLEEILSKADISIEGNNYVVRDATKLSEMLIEAGKDRDFIENSLKMLKVDESGNMIFPLTFNPNVDKIQPMLNALITNAVMRQKIEGKSYVQVSEVMLYDKRTVKEVEDLTEEQKGGIVYTKPEYKGLKKLGFVVKGKDGAQTKMAQVYAPFFFKDQNGKKISISKFVTDGVLDLTRVPEDLLVINGFRIPTEGPKSMMMFEVVGFLPDSMGDTLIVPSEIAVQMGSDYDVDKLYTYNYEVDLNSIADGEVNRAVLSKRKESNSNELIDIHKEVLLSPQMFDALTTPQGFDNLLQSVEEIEDLLEKKGVSMEKEWLGMYDPNYQRRVFFDNLAGKSGTGVSANANTFHALAQDADLYIGGTGFLFKDENGEYYDDSNVTENRVNEYDPNSYPKEKISSKNVWRLGKVLTFEGKSISNAISEWLGASVDNAKAKLLGRAGINDHNLAVGLSLVQAGFDNPLILSFINQPILKDYYDAMDNAKSMFNSKFETEKIEKAIKEVYKKYAPEKALNNLMLKDLEGFTLSEYQDMLGLSSKTVSQEQGLKQVAVLRAFLHYKGIADNIRNVQSSFVLDSKGLPKNHLEVLELVNRQDLIGGSLIKNIRNLENTVVGPYINIPRFTQKLFSDIYYYGKPAYSSLISEMKLALGKTDLLTDELNDIYNGIYSFVYSIPQIQDKVADGRNVEEYKKDLIQNLAPTIQRMKKLHPDNNLLRRVTISDGVPIIGNNFTTSDALEHQTTLSWLDMIKSDQKDLELKQLGLDLAAFTMYYNNSLFGVSNFMKYVPFEYFQSIGLSKSLQDLGKSLEEPEYLENFTKQYFQHNPSLAKSISIDFDKYTNNLTNAYTPKEIKSLEPNEVFVFGSNAEGIHGKEAALTAKEKFGAKQGQSSGLQGQSYAVVTKKNWKVEKSSTLQEIGKGIQDMLLFAKETPGKKFLVTKLGSSLAGYTDSEIKSLFKKLRNIIPDNVILPKEYEVRKRLVTDVYLNKKSEALEVTADFGSEFRPATYFPFVKNYNKLTQQYDLYELVGENTESIHYKLISHLGNEGTTISEYNFNNSNQESNLKSNLDMYQRSDIVMSEAKDSSSNNSVSKNIKSVINRIYPDWINKNENEVRLAAEFRQIELLSSGENTLEDRIQFGNEALKLIEEIKNGKNPFTGTTIETQLPNLFYAYISGKLAESNVSEKDMFNRIFNREDIVTLETKVVPETIEKVDSVKDSILTKNGKLMTDPKSLLANIQLQGSEYYRALAKHISENLGTVTIETGKLKEGRPANYFKGVITLDLDQLKDKSVVDIQRIVLHEFDHALTASKLKDPEFQQTPEYVELTDMYQAYKNTFSKEEKVKAEKFWKAYESGKPTSSKNHYLYYAYGSLDEFVTGVRTSPQVQQYMAGKLGVGKTKSIVNRIIQILKDAFKIEGNSLLEEAYDAILGVVEYGKPIVETVESNTDTFQYYGKNYKIVLKDGVGIDVSNYLGKESKKRVLLSYYNSNPDVDPQSGNKFRNKVEKQPEAKSTTYTGKLGEYELFPGVFANEGQRDALDTIKKFLKSSSDEFLLKGRGGTGKTTIINKALEGSTPSQVIGATVSDEARGILQENMQKYTTVTTASLLGLVPDYKVTTGELYFRERDSQEELDFQGKGGTDPIEGKKIIIIDESSMIGEDLYELIMKKKDKDAKVIFMGDNAQIPPIPKDGSSEKDSPVFKLEKSKDNFRELTERMRQGKESPILPITDVYAENIEDIQEGKEGLDNPLNKRVSDISQGKGVDFIIDRESFLNEFVKDLKKSEDLKETIIVAAKNKTVDALNQAVREKLFTNAKEEPFIIGDRIRVNSPYVVNKKILYPNGFKVSVKGVEKTKSSKLNVPIYKIKVIVQQYNEYTGEIELKEKFLTTVDPKDKEELKKSLNKLAIEAKKYPKRSPESAQAWKEFYDFKALFVDLGYNYAVTAHKVQGSTYNSTYVVEQDIMNFPGSRLQRNRMMYTAISRPRFKLVIYNPTQEVSVSLDSFELPSKVIDTLRKMNSKQLEIFRKMKSDGIFTTKC